MIAKAITVLLVAGSFLAASGTAMTQDVPCPWKISRVGVAKWGNGKPKAGIWFKGSFPIPPGTSERPTWYINGFNVGKAQLLIDSRYIPNQSMLLIEGQGNTIKVQFLKPPYNGASFQCTTDTFSWDDIHAGQQKWYLCKGQ